MKKKKTETKPKKKVIKVLEQETVRINGEDKIKTTYSDKTVEYRTL